MYLCHALKYQTMAFMIIAKSLIALEDAPQRKTGRSYSLCEDM